MIEFSLQGKNHSKKLRNYYAANSCPAPARMNNAVEPVPPQVVSLPAQVRHGVVTEIVMFAYSLTFN